MMSNAQVDGRAIGVRGGGVIGYGGEISYQHPVSGANRIEFDLGLWKSHLYLSGIYQWVWDLSELADGFNWYAGFGPQVALFGGDNGGLGVGVAGQVGIEYNFNIPLQLSLDYRPGFNIIGHSTGGVWDGVALGIRYKFC